MREFGGFQIWDDPSPMRPPTPEQQDRIREWFDELVATGKIRVLTVKYKSGTVTFISPGDAGNDLEGDN